MYRHHIRQLCALNSCAFLSYTLTYQLSVELYELYSRIKIMYGKKGSVRRAQNACTVCKLACDTSSSFVCDNCVETTHALRLGMADELIREFKRKNIKFCCPVCICLSEKKGGGYDWQKSLKRYRPLHFVMLMFFNTKPSESMVDL